MKKYIFFLLSIFCFPLLTIGVESSLDRFDSDNASRFIFEIKNDKPLKVYIYMSIDEKWENGRLIQDYITCTIAKDNPFHIQKAALNGSDCFVIAFDMATKKILSIKSTYEPLKKFELSERRRSEHSKMIDVLNGK